MIEVMMPVARPMGLVGPGLINSGGVSCDFSSQLGGAIFSQINSQEGKQAATVAVATDIASLKSELNLEIVPVNWLIREATYMDKARRQVVCDKTLIAKDFGGKAVQEVTDAGEHGTGTLPQWQQIDKLAKKIVDAPDGTTLFWISPGKEKSDTIVPHRATAWVKRGGEVKGYFYELPGDRETLEKMMQKLGSQDMEQKLEEQVIVSLSAAGKNFHREVIEALTGSLPEDERTQLEPTVLRKLRKEAELSEKARQERFNAYQTQYLQELEKTKEADIEHTLGIIAYGLTMLPQIIDEVEIVRVEKYEKINRLALGERVRSQDGREISIQGADSKETMTKKVQADEFTVPLALTAYTLVFIAEAAQIEQIVQKEPRAKSRRNIDIQSGIITILEKELVKDHTFLVADELSIEKGNSMNLDETVVAHDQIELNWAEEYLMPKKTLVDSSVKKNLELLGNFPQLREKQIKKPVLPKVIRNLTDISPLDSSVAFDKVGTAKKILRRVLETVASKLEAVSIPEEESRVMKIAEELVSLSQDILMVISDEEDTGAFTTKQFYKMAKLSLFLSIYSDKKTSQPARLLAAALIYHQIKEIANSQQLLSHSSLLNVFIKRIKAKAQETFLFEEIFETLVNTLSQLLNIEREKISENVLFMLYYLLRVQRMGSIYSFERLPSRQQNKNRKVKSPPQHFRSLKGNKLFPHFGIIYYLYCAK